MQHYKIIALALQMLTVSAISAQGSTSTTISQYSTTKHQAALDTVTAIINRIDTKNWSDWNDYHALVQRYAGVSSAFARHPRHFEIIAKFEQYLIELNEDKNDPYLSRLLYNHCITFFPEKLEQNDTPGALKMLKTAQRLAKTYLFKHPNLLYDALFYERATQYFTENQHLSHTAYTMKWIGLFYTGADARVIAKDGTERHVKGFFSDSQVEEKFERQREDLKMVNIEYFYYTQGQIQFEFDFLKVDASIRLVNEYNKYHEETQPCPGMIHFEAVTNYDGIMEFYHPDLIPYLIFGGPTVPSLVPYTLSDGYRAGIWMMDGSDYGGYVHEIFHNFEHEFRITPVHGFLEENRETWPQFYADTVAKYGLTMEKAYYEPVFANIMNPQGFEWMKMRERYLVKASKEALIELTGKFNQTPFDSVRQAWELRKQARQHRHENHDYPKAIETLNKALELFPYHYLSHIELAETYFWNMPYDAPEALPVFESYFEKFGDINLEPIFVDRLLSRYLEENEYEAIFSFIEKHKTKLEKRYPKSSIDWYYDRCLENLGQTDLVEKPKADTVGRIAKLFFDEKQDGYLYHNVKFNTENQAHVFNGTNSYIDLGARSYVEGRDGFTITVQFKTYGSPERQMLIQQRSKQAYNGEYMLYIRPDGKVEFFVFGDGFEAFTLTSDEIIEPNKVYKVSATRAPHGTATLFINGQRDKTKWSSSTTMVPIQVYVGADKRDNCSFFHGEIFRAVVYQGVLTDEDIQNPEFY
jgi:tetratricopeptide (TPR) repeat protein